MEAFRYSWTRAGSAPRALPSQGGAIDPYSVVVSPDGRGLAWTETLADHTRYLSDGERIEPSHVDIQLVVFDVVRDRVVGTLPRATVTACCDAGGAPRIQGILGDGRVVYYENGDVVHPHRYGPVFVWQPGTGRAVAVHVPMGGVGLTAVTSWPGGIARHGPGRHLVRVAADGTTTPVDGPSGQDLDDDAWNPAGTVLAHELRQGVAVTPLASHRSTTLPPNGNGDWRLAGWESDTDVVLVNRARPGGAVRCDVTTSVCETVGGLPAHPVRLGMLGA